MTLKRPNNPPFLIAWGCGEFGQHGLHQNGDVTCEMALHNYNSGKYMLPGDEFPINSVCGASHSLVLTDKGQVYSWGNGTSGQLGNGSSTAVCNPALVPLNIKICGMACGARHSFIWTNNGQCYSFGNNFNAQLGYNFSKADFKENQLKPVLVELFPDMKVKEVACGARHSVFLLTSGQVMAVGSNQYGQIGNDSTNDVVVAAKLDELSSISHVACGNIHSLASDENGAVYAWGYGKAFGNKTRYVFTPQKLILKDLGSSSVISLAGGDCHSMVLYDSGVLFTWGNNYEGQLGVGKKIKYQDEPKVIPSHLLPRPVIKIGCGETTSAAVTDKGHLFMWGKNAGLIHADQPLQYFQYIPHQIEMQGLFVIEVSCGAWHVSATIKNPADERDNLSENIESTEAEQLYSSDQELWNSTEGIPHSEEATTLAETALCHENWNTSTGSLIVTSEELDCKMLCRNEISDSDFQIPEKTCFVTKCALNTEMSKPGEVVAHQAVNDRQTIFDETSLRKNQCGGLDTKTNSPSNTCKTQLLVEEKAMLCIGQCEDTLLCTVEKHHFTTSFGVSQDLGRKLCCNEKKAKECRRYYENTISNSDTVTEEHFTHYVEEVNPLDSNTSNLCKTKLRKKEAKEMFISGGDTNTMTSFNAEEVKELTNDFQANLLDKTKSHNEVETLGRNDGNNRIESFFPNEKLQEKPKFKSPPIVSKTNEITDTSALNFFLGYDEVTHRNMYTFNSSSLTKCSNTEEGKQTSSLELLLPCSARLLEDFEDDIVNFRRDNNKTTLLGNQKGTNTCWTKSQSECRTQFKESLENGRRQNSDGLSNNCNDSRDKSDLRECDVLHDSKVEEQKTNENLPQESFKNKHWFKHDSVLEKDKKVTPKFTQNKKKNQKGGEGGSSTTYSNCFQLQKVLRSATSFSRKNISSEKSISCNTSDTFSSSRKKAKWRKTKSNFDFRQVITREPNFEEIFNRQQTVRLIDLSFGMRNSSRQTVTVKPSFTTFRDEWKPSSFFREKQKRKILRPGTKQESELNLVLDLERVLSNRPSVKEIEKRSKQEIQDLGRKTEKLLKNNCCLYRGEILSSICSCSKNSRERHTNVFIDRT